MPPDRKPVIEEAKHIADRFREATLSGACAYLRANGIQESQIPALEPFVMKACKAESRFALVEAMLSLETCEKAGIPELGIDIACVTMRMAGIDAARRVIG